MDAPALSGPTPPVVTIRGGPPLRPRPPSPAPAPALPLVLLVLAGLVLFVAAAHGQRPPPPPVSAELSTVGDVAVSRSGVVVVPVALHDHGPGHRVLTARTYAGPVVMDAAVSPPPSVAPGRTRRFVVLLAPDCRLLASGTGIAFNASLMVRVGNGPATQEVVLDLSADPRVAARVQALCQVG